MNSDLTDRLDAHIVAVDDIRADVESGLIPLRDSEKAGVLNLLNILESALDTGDRIIGEHERTRRANGAPRVE